MGKLTGIVLGIVLVGAAFFYTLWLIVGRKRVSPADIAAAGRYKKIFLTAVVAILSLAGVSGCKNGDKDTSGDIPRTAAVQDSGAAAASGTSTGTKPSTAVTKDWKKLSAIWQSVFIDLEGITKGDVDYSKRSETAGKLVEDHEKTAAKLVEAGVIHESTADAVKGIYSDIIYHYMRSHSGKTCYKMTGAGAAKSSLKSSLSSRISKLHELYGQGVISDSAAEKIKTDIAKDAALLEKVEDIMASTSDYPAQTQKINDIKKLFSDNKHTFSKNDPTLKAAEVIVRLLTGKGPAPAGKPAAQPGAASGSMKEKTTWIALGDTWEVLASLASADAWKDMDKSLADSQKQEKKQAALVDKLVAAGGLDKKEGDGLKAVYNEIISHLQRSYAGPTCYEMTIGGAFVQNVKGGTAMRLASLKKFIDDGTLKGDAADKIKASIAKDLHFLEKLKTVDKEFSGSGKWEQWEKKMTELQKLYENTKHVIAKNDPSHELADIIINMMKLSAEND